MELMCGAYISKKDHSAISGQGELTISKGDLLFVPDLCWHRGRMVALHYTPKGVGFVNRSDLEIESQDGKNTLQMVCNSFRAQNALCPF